MFLCGFVFININQIIVQVRSGIHVISALEPNFALFLISGLVSTPLVQYPCVGWYLIYISGRYQLSSVKADRG